METLLSSLKNLENKIFLAISNFDAELNKYICESEKNKSLEALNKYKLFCESFYKDHIEYLKIHQNIKYPEIINQLDILNIILNNYKLKISHINSVISKYNFERKNKYNLLNIICEINQVQFRQIYLIIKFDPDYQTNKNNPDIIKKFQDYYSENIDIDNKFVENLKSNLDLNIPIIHIKIMELDNNLEILRKKLREI